MKLKMRLLQLSVCIFVFLTAERLSLAAEAVPSKDGSSCVYMNSKEIEMPPERYQAHTSFCYGFASTALVQHLYCREKVGGCQFAESGRSSDDRLSVLDALAGNERVYSSLANMDSIHLLGEISERGSLARESCAPFDKFTAKTENWYGTLYSMLNSFSDGAGEASICKLAYEMKSTGNLQENINDIYTILMALRFGDSEEMRKKQFGHALVELTLPRACLKTRVRIPSFKVNSYSGEYQQSRFTEDRVSSLYLSLLSKGIPVGAQFCNSPYGCIFGMHTAVVVGYRTKRCVGRRDELELKFYDSTKFAFTRKPEGDPDQPWLDFRTFFQMQEAYRVDMTYRQQAHREEMPPSPMIYWIEKKEVQ